MSTDNPSPTIEHAGPELHPQQSEMPFAVVYGEHITELPKDLYIPPEALEIILEAFEGPLDLLLYLIKKQNLDILTINVAEITRQYMTYIDLMQSLELELAGEYMLMAAMLTEIKSRMLLPRQKAEEEEDDPRAELIRRLQEYERFKKAAEDIDQLDRIDRDTFIATAQEPDRHQHRPQPSVNMREVLLALAEVVKRAEMFESHKVHFEPLSTRERMTRVLDSLRDRRFLPFFTFFTVEEGKRGVIVTFLAIMELMKEGLIEIVQGENFGPIHVKARTNAHG